MKMTLPKLIAVDLDGTFFDDQQQINGEKFGALLDQLDAEGGHFVTATGNNRQVVDRFLASFVGRFDYVVQNGSQIVTKDNQTLVLHTLPLDKVATVQAAVAEFGEARHGNVYTTTENGYMMREDKERGEFFEHMATEFPDLIFIDSLTEIPDPITKVIINVPDDKADAFITKLNAQLAGEAYVTTSGFGAIDVIAPGINKAVGLKELAAHYGIGFDEMMAFGDGGNDLEMLQAVGHPFAMTNANETLRGQFPLTVADNNHDGVLDTIARFAD